MERGWWRVRDRQGGIQVVSAQQGCIRQDSHGSMSAAGVFTFGSGTQHMIGKLGWGSLVGWCQCLWVSSSARGRGRRKAGGVERLVEGLGQPGCGPSSWCKAKMRMSRQPLRHVSCWDSRLLAAAHNT